MHGIKILPVYGGQDIVKQIRSLKRWCAAGDWNAGACDGSYAPQNYENSIIFIRSCWMRRMRCSTWASVRILRQFWKDSTGTPSDSAFSATMPKAILDITKQFQTNAGTGEGDEERADRTEYRPVLL